MAPPCGSVCPPSLALLPPPEVPRVCRPAFSSFTQLLAGRISLNWTGVDEPWNNPFNLEVDPFNTARYCIIVPLALAEVCAIHSCPSGYL